MEKEIETTTYKNPETLSQDTLIRLAQLYALTFGAAPWFEVGRCPLCGNFYTQKGISCPKDGRFIEEAYPLKQTLGYITEELSNPQSILIIFQDQESDKLISFAWAYQTTVGAFISKKYQQDREMQARITALFEAQTSLAPDSSILYISEMGTAPEYRGKGLATAALQSLLEKAKELELPVVARTIVDSPSIYGIAIKLEMEQISGPVRDTDSMIQPEDTINPRRVLFIKI